MYCKFLEIFGLLHGHYRIESSSEQSDFRRTLIATADQNSFHFMGLIIVVNLSVCSVNPLGSEKSLSWSIEMILTFFYLMASVCVCVCRIRKIYKIMFIH